MEEEGDTEPAIIAFLPRLLVHLKAPLPIFTVPLNVNGTLNRPMRIGETHLLGLPTRIKLSVVPQIPPEEIQTGTPQAPKLALHRCNLGGYLIPKVNDP